MPSARRWSVPQGRILVSVVLGIIGAFLVCGSVGMQTWLVGGVGAAIIAVGAGLFVISAINSRATSEVEGIAHVSDRTSPPANVKFGRCRLHLIVNARGIENVSVRIRDGAVPVAKWPDRGATLPVMIPIDNPQKTRVLWNDVPTHSQVAAERARAQAAEADIIEEDFVRDADPDDLDFASSMVRPRAGSPTEVVDAEWADVDDVDDDDGDVDDSVLVDAGVRVIELDVMDPSVMRWSSAPPPSASGSAGASAAAASGPAASGAAASVATPSTRPPDSRPSPRPRGPRRSGTTYGTPVSAADGTPAPAGEPRSTQSAASEQPPPLVEPPPSTPVATSDQLPPSAEPPPDAATPSDEPRATATDDVAPAEAGSIDLASDASDAAPGATASGADDTATGADDTASGADDTATGATTSGADDTATRADGTASGADGTAHVEEAPAGGASFADSPTGRSTGAESGHDSAEHAAPTGPDGEGVTAPSGPPEWPPRRASTAQPYRWDPENGDGDQPAPLPRRRPAIEIAVDREADDAEPDGDHGDAPADGPHVPHHRPVPPDEVFGQDASPND